MVMDLLESLSPLERKVLKVLKENKKLAEIQAASKLSEIEVLRALQFLENKGIIKTKKQEKEIILLDENGLDYARNKLPERRFLEALKDRELTLDEIKEKAKLNDDELKISLGVLKSKAAINLGSKISLTNPGKNLLDKELYEEHFLHKLLNGGLTSSGLSDNERYALNELKKRKKIIKIENIREIEVDLLDSGEKLASKNLDNNLIESLDTEMLKKGSWKGKKFRRYDIDSALPRIYGGRRHFVNESKNYIKRIWLDMGFKEMTGSLVQPCFWNFDALFVPQDHPVREMQDTFFVEGKIDLKEKEIISRVKATHENGWTTKSKGWGYQWNLSEAQKLVLRTHTTGLSARMLASLKKFDLPAKFFAVGNAFRNETVDWKHSFEFLQSEGIVIDENINLRNLIGYLKEFFVKMGFEKIRVKPSFFAFTEPSLEVEIWHPEKKEWVEVAGAGIFRPELTKPLLGFECPVAAWGIGIDRSIMDQCAIKDIRELHKNDLKQLKEMKTFIK